MGEVFRARDTRLNRTVAIKISQRRFTGRFKSEARAVAALNHPNIVQVYELESANGDDFIVMEFVPGRTLAELLRATRLNLDQALEYANQIASALAAAHAAGVVHRDIKPGNIMVSDAGVVKILDFGLAKVEKSAVAGDTTVTAGAQTGSGTVLGTAAYMSPEQAEGKAVDARSDIFSTGALFYEMLTGSRAFDGDSNLEVLSKVFRETPRGIRELRPEVPESIARVISRCMEKDPALRYPSGKELAGELLLCSHPPRARLSAGAPRAHRSGAGCHNRLVRLVVLPELACTLVSRRSAAADPKSDCQGRLPGGVRPHPYGSPICAGRSAIEAALV